MSSSNFLPTIKTVVVGDGMCGKTCMLTVYKENKFPLEYIPTVFDNFEKTVYDEQEGSCKTLLLYDTSGQEDYERLRSLQYIQTDVFVLCFAIDSLPSYQNIKYKWIGEIKSYKVPIVLVGLKGDLRSKASCSDSLMIPSKSGEKLAKRIGAIKYLECSALENQGIDEIFQTVAKCATTRNANRKNTCCFCCLTFFNKNNIDQK